MAGFCGKRKEEKLLLWVSFFSFNGFTLHIWKSVCKTLTEALLKKKRKKKCRCDHLQERLTSFVCLPSRPDLQHNEASVLCH